MKNDAFYAAVDDPLDSAIKGAPDGTLVGVAKDELSNLHKDAKECI